MSNSNIESLHYDAIKVFENDDYADEWMNMPNSALGGRAPAEVAATDEGSAEVKALLEKIASEVRQ